MIYSFSESDDHSAGEVPLDQSRPDFRSDMEQEHPIVQVHNQGSADIALAARKARETINITGGWCDVFLRTDNADHDTVWDEDPDPTYYQPIKLKAFYPPKPMELSMKPSGPDGAIKIEVIFAYSVLVERLGTRLIREGDVIQLPYNMVGETKPTYFTVINASPSQNYRYNWLFFTCTVESTQADITVLPDADKERQISDYLGE